jgi:hypothetical protein
MTASIVPNAVNQFIDINGNPLVGGKVYFYVPLTMTPKNTWQDAEQNALNTNPVILDSRGQAVIYGTGSYRQILTDADDNLIWDQEIENFQESVFGPQASIASATTTDLGSVGSNNVLINGTTTINSFGTSATLANPIYFIQFGGILTLTYNATSMILPGAANITTAAGDSALVEFTNIAGYWRMIAYFPGTAGGALGTAAAKNIGTSGGTVPLLNGNNSWSGTNEFLKQTSCPEIALTVISNVTTPDFSLANNFNTTINASLTINNPINVGQGQSGVLFITQNNAGLTVTWGSAFKSPGGIANVNLSGTVAASDFFAYYVHSPSFIIITPILNPT